MKATQQNSGASIASTDLSRRRFLFGGAAAVLGTAAFSSGRVSDLARFTASGHRLVDAAKVGTISFWDMAWGTPSYNKEGAALVKKYDAAHPSNPQVTYLTVTWDNWYEKFASAIASHTNPDCSSGAGYQPFQFAALGAIEPLDQLVGQLKKSGVAEDFYTNSLELMRYKGHYIGLPWSIDIRVLYYRKSILTKFGLQVPRTWDDLLTIGKTLKKHGIYLLNAAGNTAADGWQFLPMPFLLGNGGGFFNAKGEPDTVTPENLEAVEFILKLSKDGYIDPKSIDFNSAEMQSEFGSGRVAFSYGTAMWAADFSPAVADDMSATSPLTSPSGKKGTIFWVAPLMAYKGANMVGVNDFFASYLNLMGAYWKQGLVSLLPARKSLAPIAIKETPSAAIPLNEWLPIAKTTAAVGTSLSPGLNAVEGSPALGVFTQQLISGTAKATTILKTLQGGVEKAMSSAG